MTIDIHQQQSTELAHTEQDYHGDALVQWAMAADRAYTIAQRLATTSFVPQSLRGKPYDITAAILAGGSSLRDYARPDGELGYFSKQWRVYGREGEPCSCGALVRRRTEGGRSTFWCARCQKA